jgi:hypothetical protein
VADGDADRLFPDFDARRGLWLGPVATDAVNGTGLIDKR